MHALSILSTKELLGLCISDLLSGLVPGPHSFPLTPSFLEPPRFKYLILILSWTKNKVDQADRRTEMTEDVP